MINIGLELALFLKSSYWDLEVGYNPSSVYKFNSEHNTATAACTKSGATVKDGDTLAITNALLPIVFQQMPVRFSVYTYL